MSRVPEDLIESVDSLESFLEFVKVLATDARSDRPRLYASGTHGWENGTIEAFLEAMCAWATDSESLPPSPSWRDVAQLLLAGKAHE